MDQIIRRAQLPERPAGQLVDIGIEAGSIVAIDTPISTDAPSYDAAGRLVCGGLIESHIHLDKGRLLDVVPAPPGGTTTMTLRAINQQGVEFDRVVFSRKAG